MLAGWLVMSGDSFGQKFPVFRDVSRGGPQSECQCDGASGPVGGGGVAVVSQGMQPHAVPHGMGVVVKMDVVVVMFGDWACCWHAASRGAIRTTATMADARRRLLGSVMCARGAHC